MEGVMGGNSVQPNSINKSEVLDVKSVRTLVPIFPLPSNGAPFVCVPPNGPFLPGFRPFSHLVDQTLTKMVSIQLLCRFGHLRPNLLMAKMYHRWMRIVTKDTNRQPMDARGNQGHKPATPVDAHGNPVKKRGRGRSRTRFP